MFKEYDPINDKLFQVMDEKGKIVSEKYIPDLSDDQIVEAYQHIVFARQTDLLMLSYQRQGRMYTFPPNQGQEAISVGVGMNFQKGDWLVPAYRELGAWLMKGANLRDIFLYWRGDEDGSMLRGAENMLPSSVPISSQLLHAAGIGYAMKYKNQKNVAYTFFGDGGTSEGDFHEAMNFASVWKAPVVFVNQNNQYAISFPVRKQTASKNLAIKSYAYGMRGIKVDGNDFLAMYKAVNEAAKFARDGEGPTLIESLTYRLGSHTTSDDPSLYRSKEEEAEWQKKDPIIRLKAYLTGKKKWSDKKDEEFIEEARKKIDASFAEAEGYRPYPLENVFKFHYEEMPDDLKNQQLRYERYQKWLENQK